MRITVTAPFRDALRPRETRLPGEVIETDRERGSRIVSLGLGMETPPRVPEKQERAAEPGPKPKRSRR